MLSIGTLNFIFIGEFASLISLLCGKKPVNVCHFSLKFVLLETYFPCQEFSQWESYSIGMIIL